MQQCADGRTEIPLAEILLAFLVPSWLCIDTSLDCLPFWPYGRFGRPNHSHFFSSIFDRFNRFLIYPILEVRVLLLQNNYHTDGPIFSKARSRWYPVCFVPGPIRLQAHLNFLTAPQTKNGSLLHLTNLPKIEECFSIFVLLTPGALGT